MISRNIIKITGGLALIRQKLIAGALAPFLAFSLAGCSGTVFQSLFEDQSATELLIMAVMLENAPPKVKSITSSTANGLYGSGDDINISVTFNKPVTLAGGALNVTLDTGAVVPISATSYPAATLTGTYTVASGEQSLDLNATLIALDTGATLVSEKGKAAVLAMPSTTLAMTKSIMVDGVFPVVTFTSTPDINDANSIDYTVTGTCSEEGRTVNVHLGGTDPAAFNRTLTCTGGAFTTGSLDVSAIADTLTFEITADQTDAAGNTETASASVIKNTVNPVVVLTSTPAINIANNTSYSVSGDCSEEGRAVDVLVEGTLLDSPTCTGGSFTASGMNVSSILDSPSINITARHTNSAGNLDQNSTTVVKDTVRPTVSIGAPSSTLVNSSGSSTFTLTYDFAPSPALVPGNITVNGSGGTTCSTVNITGGGTTTPSVTVSGCTGNGSYTINVAAGRSADAVGNPDAGAGPSASVAVDNTLPTVSFSPAPVNINNSNLTTYAVSGSCSEEGRTVTVTVGGTVSATPACTGGTFSTGTMTVSGIADGGSVSVAAAHTDAAGNSATASTTVIKDTGNPTVAFTSTPSINNSNVAGYTVTGTCSENGQAVNVSIGGTVSASPTCGGGVFSTGSLGVSSIPDNASVSITASHSDAVGNPATPASTTVIKDTVDPSVALTSTPVINIANASSYTVSGTCSENGQIVTVSVNGVPRSTPTCTGGNFTASSMDVSGVTDGPGISVTAGHSDIAGNTALDSTTVVKDTVRPTVSIGAPDDTLINSGGTSTFVLTYEVAPSPAIDSSDITFSYTGGVTCSTVNVTGGGTTNPSVAISGCSGNGTARINVAAAQSTDAAGNADAGAGPSAAVTVDNAAPTVSFTSTPVINIANSSGYTVSGNCSENGQTVTVTVGGSVSDSPACGGGTFTTAAMNVSGLVDSGTVSVTANHTDAAGNNATQASTTVVKDTVRPTVSIGAPDDTLINSGGSSTFVLTYEVAPSPAIDGSDITVTGAGGVTCSTVNVTSGGTTTPSVTVSGCSGTGTFTISVAAAQSADAAGNADAGAGPSAAVTVDNTAPTVAFTSTPAIGNGNVSNYSVSGTCSENGRTVTVTVGGTVSSSPTCGGGTFTASGMDVSSIADGPAISVTATHSDAAGNAATPASTTVLKDISSAFVSFTSTPSINNSNKSSYTVTGSCSYDTWPVSVSIGGTVNANPTCTGGTFTTGALDVSGLGDSGSVSITADHNNTVNFATQASTTVIKDTVDPTVALTSTPVINLANASSYSVSGTCSDNGRLVVVSVNGTPYASPSCTGGNFTASSMNVSGVSDGGAISVTAGHSDAAGNTALASGSVVKDTVRPTVSIGSPSASPINSSGSSTFILTFEVAPSPALVGSDITVNGSGGVTCSTVNVTGGGTTTPSVAVSGCTGNGSFTITVAAAQSADAAGNADAGAGPSSSVTVDNTLPTVSFTSTPVINIANASNYTVAGACSENGRTVTVSVGGTVNATPTCTANAFTASGLDVSGLGDNPALSITANHTDAAGNNATQASTTVVKDTVRPSVSIGAPSSSLINSSGSATFTLTYEVAPSPNLVSGDITVNGSGGVTCSTVNVTGGGTTTPSVAVSGCTGNGSFTITVAAAQSADAAGNTDAGAGPSSSVTVDNAVPTVSFTSTPTINIANQSSYSVSGNCSENGRTVSVSVGGSVNASPTCSGGTFTATGMNVSGLSDSGSLSVTANHSDAAGNAATQASASVVKDTVRPLVTIGSPTNSLINSAGSTIFGLTYEVAPSPALASGDITVTGSGGVTCSTVNITGGDTTTPDVTVSGCTGNGSFTITVAAAQSADAAGNTDAGAGPSSSVSVDNTAPTVAFTSTPAISSSNATSYVVSGTCSENGRTVSVTVGGTVNNSPTCSGGNFTTASMNVSGIADGGSVSVAASHSDAAGNTANASTTVVKDTAPLTITSAQTVDNDHNGKIDHYKISFNKSVKDSTFPGFVDNASMGSSTLDWLVSGYNNRKIVGATHAPDIDASDNANDAVIYLAFDEKSGACDSTSQAGCDSGNKPDLTTTSTPGLQDMSGNVIAQVDVGTVTEADGAAPIVVKATGINNTSASVQFSESVQASTAECGAGSSQSGVVCSTRYTVSGSPAGVSVSSAIMSGGAGVDGTTVVLTTSAQTDLRSYTVTVTSGVVRDLATNQLTSGNTATFTGQPVTLTVLSAAATNNTTVRVTFNDSVAAATAECSGATACDAIYTIPSLGSVTNAVMAGGSGVDGTIVVLTTGSQTSTSAYTLTVASGVVQNTTHTAYCSTPNNTTTFNGDTLPYLTLAASIDGTHVDVTYSEDVKWDTSATGALLNTNYCIENATTDSTPQVCDNPALGASSSFTISSQTAGRVVRITHPTTQTSGTLYRVTVQNVVDTTPTTPNPIRTAANANTQNFAGLEDIKIVSAERVIDNSPSFTVFKVTFSKAFQMDGGIHSVNYTGLANWSFPAGLNTVTLCTSADDVVCPTGITSGDSVIYFKATPEPARGAYTVVGATAAGSPPGAVGCIQNLNGSPACLQANPNDRATLTISLPENIGEGPVYDDPFNDYATLSGQVVKYNDKLLIGPNYTDSGLFQVDNNLTNSVSIILDADNGTAGSQPFRGNATPNTPPSLGVWESCRSGYGTWPNCTQGNYLAGIDYFYAGCYDSSSPFASSTLTGSSCTAAGGTEYLMILGYVTSATNQGYQSNWNTTSTTSPFSFAHVLGLSNYQQRTYRAMSAVIFKGYVYQASQHQMGSVGIRWNRFTPSGGTIVDLSGQYLHRMGQRGSIYNGEAPYVDTFCTTNNCYLISIDTMYEYDNDDTGTNVSSLYIANGGACGSGCLTSPYPRTTTTYSDGGVLRLKQDYSGTTPPTACTDANDCNTKWEDVTPNAVKWRQYMSKALPKNASAGNDWDYTVPANTITPALKAIPKMVTFNGDLYMLRNACSSTTVQTLNATTHNTCPSGSEVPQLWRLPKYTGTCSANLTGTIQINNNSRTVNGTGTSFTTQLVIGDVIMAGGQAKIVLSIASDTQLTTTEAWSPAISAGTTASTVKPPATSSACSAGGYTWTAGTNGNNYAANWELVAESATSAGRTSMANATWVGRTITAANIDARNTELTLLVVNGDRLYIGYDNATDGVNIWRTKSGVTKPTSESDFEAVCQSSGTVCSVPSKQFGLGGVDTRIFDGISVNDAGTDYVIVSARNGTNPLRIYRTANN